MITGSPVVQLVLIAMAVGMFLSMLWYICKRLDAIADAQKRQATAAEAQGRHQKNLVEVEAARALVSSGQLGSDENRAIKAKLRDILGLPYKA